MVYESDILLLLKGDGWIACERERRHMFIYWPIHIAIFFNGSIASSVLCMQGQHFHRVPKLTRVYIRRDS